MFYDLISVDKLLIKDKIIRDYAPLWNQDKPKSRSTIDTNLSTNVLFFPRFSFQSRAQSLVRVVKMLISNGFVSFTSQYITVNNFLNLNKLFFGYLFIN